MLLSLVLQYWKFLDQIPPKAEVPATCSCTQMGASPRGCISYQEESGHYWLLPSPAIKISAMERQPPLSLILWPSLALFLLC